jgi:pilus assembly protein CpaB
MRLVFGLVLIAGLGLAGFAVYMAQNYIGAYEVALREARSKQSGSVPTTQIYVATKPIAYGEEITEEHVRLAPWPTEILPENAFTAENPIMKDGQERRVALRAIDQFEALLPTKVSVPGGDAGLTTHLKAGESAFAIEVDVASGVSGFLRPGDRVDVYWTGRVTNAGEVTKLIQTGIRLIAIDQNSEQETSATTIARTVTVAASRDQVATLTHGQSTGKLTLSLINQNAMAEKVTTPIEVDQMSMLGIAPQQAPAPVQKKTVKTCTTRVRRGADVVEIPIPCTN